MQYIEKRLEQAESVRIMPLGDLHVGDKNCSYELIKEYVNYAVANRLYVIGMGDLLNCATKTSPGKGPFDQSMDTSQQFDYVVRLLRPLADRGLLLGLLQGNHCERMSKEGTDIMQMLSSALGVPYLGYSAVIKFVVGRNAYTIFATHGHGGGASKAGVLNKIQSLNQLVEADIYLRGHSHQLMYCSDVIRKVDCRNNKLIDVKRHYLDTGSFLGYDEGYPDQSNLRVAEQGAPIVTLSGERNKRHVAVQIGL